MEEFIGLGNLEDIGDYVDLYTIYLFEVFGDLTELTNSNNLRVWKG